MVEQFQRSVMPNELSQFFACHESISKSGDHSNRKGLDFVLEKGSKEHADIVPTQEESRADSDHAYLSDVIPLRDSPGLGSTMQNSLKKKVIIFNTSGPNLTTFRLSNWLQ